MVPAVLSLILLVACKRPDAPAPTAAAPEAAPAAAPSTVFAGMTQVIVPRSALVWELAGNLYDDDGKIDANKLTAQQWQELAQAASAMRDAAASLAQAGKVTVADAGVKLQNEGSPGAFGAAQVQAVIDADMPGFKAEALKLQAVANEIAVAAAARDGVKTDEGSERLNEVCSGCHARFWYPNQPSP
jgi:hypothetical protein